MSSYVNVFKNKLLDTGKDKNLVPAELLKAFLQGDKEFNYNTQYFQFFWDLIVSSSVSNLSLNFSKNISQIKIKKSAFEQVLRAWCAFSTIDRSHTNLLCTADLRLLLYIYQGQEPSDWIVRQDLLEIDED